MPPKYRKRRRRNNLGLMTGILAVMLVVLIVVAVTLPKGSANPSSPSSGPSADLPSSSATVPSTDPAAPTEPSVIKVSTATISNTGDILMHRPVFNSGYDAATGKYDYAEMLAYLKKYAEDADYAVANLETTLAGTDNGYHYSGYPSFNCPDGIVPSMQNAGFDMLLTANNHTYDTKDTGFDRTQKIIQQYGMDYLGTVTSTEDHLWQVKDINGIKIGMVCYTYESGDRANGYKELNGIRLSQSAGNRIGSFSYQHLNEFYNEMQQNIEQMEAAGAEAVVLYLHWGEEYQLRQNASQTTIAQKMCDLGVDVIVGGHPHVVQPMELLTSTQNPDQKMICLYSMGNAVSNQNHEEDVMDTAHTEDGVLFSFTFAKYSDGTVILESAEILPTWVWRQSASGAGAYTYRIVPLDKQLSDWKSEFSLTDQAQKEANASYNRTMAIVGKGLGDIQSYLSQLVQQTEARLGVK